MSSCFKINAASRQSSSVICLQSVARNSEGCLQFSSISKQLSQPESSPHPYTLF
jgi:hypothetical protein